MQVFRDPEQYVETVKRVWSADSRVDNTRAPYRCLLSQKTVGFVTCLRLKTTPTVYHIAGSSAGATSFVFLDPGSPPVIRNGVTITDRDLFVWRSQIDTYSRADYAYGCCAVSIPNAHFDRFFDEPPAVWRIRPAERALDRLRRVFWQSTRPEPFLFAVIECIETAYNSMQSSDRNRTRYVFRFQNFLDESGHWAQPLGKICNTMGIHERTLRRACEQCLGIGPHEYMTNRRLTMVRHALAGSPLTAKVADVAADYGFFDHSRFSKMYRQHYGEAPSDTLRSKDSVSA